MATTYQTAQGEIGEATLCMVRLDSNPLGPRYVVRAERADGWVRTYYDGPDALVAEAQFAKAKTRVWAE